MTKNKLRSMTIEEVKDLVPDKEIVELVEKGKEHVFKITDEPTLLDNQIDPLVRIEVSLRRCERVGVFH